MNLLAAYGMKGLPEAGTQIMSETAQLITLKEAADALAISSRTVARLVKAGELQSVAIGRRRLIRLATLHAWLAEREKQAA